MTFGRPHGYHTQKAPAELLKKYQIISPLGTNHRKFQVNIRFWETAQLPLP